MRQTYDALHLHRRAHFELKSRVGGGRPNTPREEEHVWNSARACVSKVNRGAPVARAVRRETRASISPNVCACCHLAPEPTAPDPTAPHPCGHRNVAPGVRRCVISLRRRSALAGIPHGSTNAVADLRPCWRGSPLGAWRARQSSTVLSPRRTPGRRRAGAQEGRWYSARTARRAWGPRGRPRRVA